MDTLTLAGTTGITGTTTINGSGSLATNIGTGTSTGTITIGRTTNTDLVLNDANWSVTGAGAATFASIASGATTLSGNLDMATNLILNIGNAGTDFTSGGGLTLAGNLIANGNSTFGDAASDTVIFNAVVASNIIPDDNTRNFGSAGLRWANGYFDSISANNISGVVVTGSTSSNDWLINSDNATNNAELSTLTFERGSPILNAVMQWNATGDASRVDSAGGNFNDNFLYNYPISIFSQVSGANQTFTSGSLFKFYQNATNAITQSAAFIGTSYDFSSNITVPNSSSGNQTGSLVTLKDGGVSATAIGYQTAGTFDFGLDIGGTPGTAEIRLSNAETISNLVDGTIALTAPTVSTSAALSVANGFTLTTGALSFTSTSGTISNTGLTDLTQTLSSGTAAITAPTLNLNTSSTGITAIGNATGNIAFGGALDMQTNIISNIGNAGTDFLSNGGLTLANAFTVTTGGAVITGNSSVTGNLSITGNTTLGDATGDTVTANADAWTFANDTNFALTGGVNGLSFDTTTLSIDATNDRVGIGTTTPEAKLHSLATTEQLRLGYDASNYLSVTTGSTGAVAFAGTGSGAAFSFNKTMTITPGTGTGLIVNGGTGGATAFVVAGVANAYAMSFTTTSTPGQSFGALYSAGMTAGDVGLYVRSGNGVRPFLMTTGAGNVGIQTSTPTTNFQVAQNTTGVGTVSNSAGGTTVTGTNTLFTNTFQVGDTITIVGETVTISAIGSDTSMTVAAITNENTAVAYTLVGGIRFSVLGYGNVGIGTTAPSQLLGVGSTNQFTVSSAGAVVGVGVNSGSGLLQGTGGLTLLGTTNVNTSGANATNIGTGTNSGTITIGNVSTGDLVLNDANWSVTGAGAATFASIASGATTLSGNLDMQTNIISNIGNAGTDFLSNGGLTLANAFTVTTGGAVITGNSSVTGNLSITGNTTLGDATGDTVTANADAWTFANDTNFALTGGVNGLSFDTTTLSIDATNDRVGIGTTAPEAKLQIEAGSTAIGLTIRQNNNNNLFLAYANLATTPTYAYNLYSDASGNAGQILYDSTGTENISLNTAGASYITGILGIGDTTPDAKLEVLATTEQLRLTYTDNSVDSRFTVDSSGDLTINNTGTKTIIADDLQVTGNDILDSGATSRITLGATTTLTNTTTALSGTSTLTASSLATFTTAATLGMGSTTTLNLGAGATINPASGTLSLGTANATAVAIGATGVTTTNNGSLTSTQTLTASNGLTLTTGALSLTATSGSIALTGFGTTSITSTTATGNINTLANDSLTTGTDLALTSTATALSSGGLLSLSKTGASGSTAFTGDIANITYSQTFNGGVGLTSTGNVVDVSRAITLNNTGNTHTVSGALVALSSTGTQTVGTLTDTANILSLTQSYAAASGAVLAFANSGAGVDVLGTSSTWQVTKAGAATFASIAGPISGSAGSFTTLSSTGVTTLGDNSATVAINSSDWDIDATGVMTGISGITTNGVYTQTGTSANTFTGDTTITSTATTGTGLTVTGNSLTTGNVASLTSTSTAGGASGVSKLLDLARSGTNAQLAHTAYGVYSAVTNTNATSGTNIAGYFSASGATTANYGLIVAAGNVGIGTASPTNTLDVRGSGLRVDGQYTENTTNAGVYLGRATGDNTPRILFANGTDTQNWQIDNNSGTFRWYLPSVTHMELTTTTLSLPSKVISVTGTGNNYFAGNVGIGTTTPGAKLGVTDAANTTSFNLTNNTATTLGVGINTTGVMDLQSTSLTTGNFMNIELNALTTGAGINLSHTTSVIASGGSLARIASTSIDTGTTTGVLLDLSSTASLAGTQFLQTYSALTTGIGQSIITNALTAGTALNISTSSTAFTGDLVALTLSGSHASNTGNLLDLTNSGTASTNTALYVKHYATGTGNMALRVDDVSGDTSPFVILGDGNVGIGETNPYAALEMGITTTTSTAQPVAFNSSNSGTHTYAFFTNRSTGNSVKAGIQFGTQYSATNKYSTSGIFSVQTSSGGNTIGDLTFDLRATTGATSLTEAMRITSDGKVGIGITAPTAKFHIVQTATATGVLTGIVYTGAVNTNQTLSTEIPSLTLTTAGRQWATGALTTQREVLITQPTYSFVGSSTITNAATVGIAGAPIAGTNATLTNTHGLLIQAGAVAGGTTNSYGLTVNAQTGATNNYGAVFATGNVGIGTTAPGGKLDVNGIALFSGGSGSEITGGGSRIQIVGGYSTPVSGRFIIGDATGWKTHFSSRTSGPVTSDLLTIQDNGNVGIGTTAPANLLHVYRGSDGVVARFEDTNGTCDVNPTSTALVCASDIRLKRNVVTLPDSLDKIMALRSVSFKWNSQTNNDKRIGFIAQEVEQIIPELVSTSADGYKSIAHTNFIPFLVGAIQEQQINITNLEQDLEITSAGILNIKENAGTYTVRNTQTGNLVSRIGTFAELAVANIQAGLITAQNVTSNTLQVTSTLTANILNVRRVQVTETLISPIIEADHIQTNTLAVNSDATISGTLYVDNIKANNIEGLSGTFENLIASSTATQNIAFEQAQSQNQRVTESIRARIDSLAAKLNEAQISSVSSQTAYNQVQEILNNTATTSGILAFDSNSWGASPSSTIASADISSLGNLSILGNTNIYGTTTLGNTFVSGSFILSSVNTSDQLTLSSNTIAVIGGSLNLLATNGVNIMNGALIVNADGSVYINNDLFVAGAIRTSNITSVDNLNINLPNTGAFKINNETGRTVATLDASGSAQISKLIIAASGPDVIASDSATITSNSTAGVATLTAGSSEIVINNPKVTDNTLIYVTPTSATGNLVVYVKNKVGQTSTTTGKFTVGTDMAYGSDISFNWWIIDLK